MGDYTYQFSIGEGRVPYVMFIGGRLVEELRTPGQVTNLYSVPGNADYYIEVAGARVHLKGDVGRLEALVHTRESASLTGDDVAVLLQGIVDRENSSFPLGGRPEELVTS